MMFGIERLSDGAYRCRTPSKVNLMLAVTGRRPDGYHTIETLFWPLREPHDVITLAPAEKLSIETESLIPKDERNLCWKAVEKFAAAVPEATANWCVSIDKHIPVAGGMAGGSTDGAAVLKLLNHACSGVLSETELSRMALSLGADVPFFLNPVPSVGRGVGEQLTRLDDLAELNLNIALRFSNFPVPAAWAYQHRTGPFSPEGAVEKMVRFLRRKDWGGVSALIRNDLGRAVFRKFPVLERQREELQKAGALAVELSGSGPTVFALMP